MEKLRVLLREMRRREALFHLLAAMLWAGAVGAGLLLVLSVADRFFCLQAHVREVLLRGLEAVLGASAVYVIVVVVLARKGVMRIAWGVERARPEFRDSLITALEGKAAAGDDEEVLGAVEERAYWLLERTDPDDVISSRPLLRGAQAAGGVLAAWMLAALLLGGALAVSARRILFPSLPIHPPTKTRIVEMSPGRARKGLGGEVEFRCRTEGPADSAHVLISYDRKDWRDLPMERDESGAWRAKLDCLRDNAVYYFQAGSTKTDLMTLTACEPPAVEDMRVSAVEPGGRKASFACPHSVRVRAGSDVTVRARAGGSAEEVEAWIEFADGRRLRMKADGRDIEASFKADESCRYRVGFRSGEGQDAQRSCWREVQATGSSAGREGKGSSEPGGGKSASEKAGSGKAAAGKAGGGKPGSGKPGSGKSASGKADGEKAGSAKLAAASGSKSPGQGGRAGADGTSPIEERSELELDRAPGLGMGRSLREGERSQTREESSLPGGKEAVSVPPDRAIETAPPLPPKELERLAREAELRTKPEYRELVGAYYRTLARSEE